MSKTGLKPLLGLAGALLALAAAGEELPPLCTPPTEESHPGKLIWADLFTSDQAAAEKFYTGLFGWTSATLERPSKHPLIILSNGDRPVAGIALRPRQLHDEVRGRWVGFFSAKDAALATATVTTLGGRIVFPEKDLPERGTQAIAVDPQGALFGILHSSSGDPGDYRPDNGDFAWTEYFARDTAAAFRFYHGVFSYAVTPDDREGLNHSFVFSGDGYARGALAPLPDKPHARPGWLLFVRVASADDSAAKAASLGGRVLVAARQADPSTRIAILRDPVGAAIGIVELSAP